MEDNFTSFHDLKNVSLRVTLNRKKYNAVLLERENTLILRIDMTNDLEKWRNEVDYYDLITGNILFNGKEITLINCKCIGQESLGTKNIISATLDYEIDRLLIGKKITKSESKNIESYEVYYNNIDCFTNNKPYKLISGSKIAYQYNPTSYSIGIDDLIIMVNFSCKIEEHEESLVIKKETSVSFKNNKKINLKKVLDNIYKFRNFLMLLLKKGVIVEKQYVYFDGEKYQLLDCRNDFLIETNQELNMYLKHRCLKIEDIGNISEIYKKYVNNYKKLYPLLEMYYNVTKYSVPNLTRFVNAITMIEDCSRVFDYKSALTLTKQKYNNQAKKRVKDPEFKYEIMSLINNVNSIFKLSDAEIDQISENIKNARIYYIHYKNKSTVKQLSYNEQFWYSFFMEDIVLLNIYKILKLDIDLYEDIAFLGFYYDIKQLL